MRVFFLILLKNISIVKLGSYFMILLKVLFGKYRQIIRFSFVVIKMSNKIFQEFCDGIIKNKFMRFFLF